MPDAAASEKFCAVFTGILNVEPASVCPESSRDTLEEWDSIHHMHLILALEEAFGIEFSDDEICELASLADLMTAMRAKTGQPVAWQ